jgi:Ni/Fe-hydrogenase subunit HybB-like protein
VAPGAIERALPWILALGLLLPTMHQSSLGSLPLIAGGRLHPFWHTPVLPLLFLVSALAMGYAAVAAKAPLGSLFLRRPAERAMLASLSAAVVPVLLLFVIVRAADLAAVHTFDPRGEEPSRVRAL